MNFTDEEEYVETKPSAMVEKHYFPCAVAVKFWNHKTATAIKNREQNGDEVWRFCRLNFESFGDIITIALFIITTNPFLQKKSWNVTAKKSLSRSHFAVWDPVAFAVAGKFKKSRKLRWHPITTTGTAAKLLAVPLFSVAVGIAVFFKHAFRGIVRTGKN